MKTLHLISATALALSSISSAEVFLGGVDTTMVSNWTTNDVLFSQGTSDGFALDWENVVVNSVVIDGVANDFILSWETGTDYTVGHMFMYNETIDLADLAAEGGVQTLDWTANFETGAFANWSPVISVTDAGVTTYYRWNHANNNWTGNDDLDFSLGIFDLSQLGNGVGAGAGNTVIWGEMVAIPGASITNFGQTRINNNNPFLQATTGVLQFGFIQWAQDGASAIAAATDFSTAIDFFEIVVNSDAPIVAPTVSTVATTADGATSATLRGEIADDGGDFPNATIFYGTTDGGDIAANWDSFVDLGFQAGAFATEVEGLEPETMYFYRAFATNSAGGDWADVSESVTTLALTTIDAVLASDDFAYRYEMDIDPSGQNLDMAGSANDWRPGGSGAFGIPMVAGGIAISDATTSPPGNLFRTDDAGSIQRQSLLGGDFTIEVGVRVTTADAGDAGIFGFALDPGGDNSSFRLNISNEQVSLDGNGNTIVATSSNADVFHAFRIAWVASTDEYTVWRDGEEIYSALAGTNGPFNNDGAFFIGDFSGSLSGEWEVDYIRLHDSAVAPPAAAPLQIIGIQILDNNVAITWRGEPGVEYALSRSNDLTPSTSGTQGRWQEIDDELNGATGAVQTTIVEPVVEGSSTFYRIGPLE